MNTLTMILGIVLGLMIIMILKSFYSPKPATAQAIMLFGKLYTIIANIEGKKVCKKATGTQKKWDLIPQTGRKRLNIYFFPWPFFQLYYYDLTYLKEKRAGEEKKGDTIIWSNKKTNTNIISRTGRSDHLRWRVEYPTITTNLETEEILSVHLYTNNFVELTNPADAFFGIQNWYEAINDILHGGLRGLVSAKKIKALNEYSSEDKGKFNSEMLDHANNEVSSGPYQHMSLPSFGFKLIKSVFKDYEAGNEKTQEVMDSYGNVTLAEQKGEADKIKATKDGQAKVITADQEAIAYGKKQEAIVAWMKKYKVETGLAKTDAAGNITELVPDANVKVTAEALKELSKLTGTLVMDGGLTKMLSINPNNNNPVKNEEVKE